MFYDLESPVAFVKDIESVLADDGIWHFEQSYMPSMLRTNSYDTICHEHLEFYSFKVVKNILESCGMRVVDVQMNAINGGSFAVTACKKRVPLLQIPLLLNGCSARKMIWVLTLLSRIVILKKEYLSNEKIL
jgi:hypothetical protein